LIHSQIKDSIRFVLDRLNKNGFQSYIVGGAVRDIMLERAPHDFDILTNASVKEMESVFFDQKIKKVGKAFPVCLVNGVEISSGRDRFDLESFPESDLAKRDFTINSMAYDHGAKKIMDPFNGRRDLKDSVIRFTKDPGKRIKEDPVRMVRACRFLAMIQGSFSMASLDMILECRDLLNHTVAKERIHNEIYKALALKKPSLFFKALRKTGLLVKIFPSLDRCYELDGGPHHGETVFEHNMLVGDALPASSPGLRLAGFLHDIGKFDAAKMENGRLTFKGHENYGGAAVLDLKNLRFSVREITYIESMIKVHMRPLTDETSPRAVRRILAMLDQYNLDYRDFMHMRIADKKGNLAKRPYTITEIRVRLKKILDEMAAQSVFSINHLKITGSDISRITGVTPGPEIGKIKQMLFEKVLDDPGLNHYDELEKAVKDIHNE